MTTTTPKPNWIQSPTPGFRRATIVQPGFDCGIAGEKCEHDVKGNHGQHCPEWWFIVSNGRYAVTLIVMSGNFPRGRPLDGPTASAFAFHAPTTTSVDAIREGVVGEACDYIETGRCFGESEYNYAHKVWARHGQNRIEQSEAFWLDLEDELAKHVRDHELKLATVPTRCPTCNGEGVVPKVKS